MNTPSTNPNAETLTLDVVSEDKLARAIRAAYTLGWRDRGDVDAAVDAGLLVAPEDAPEAPDHDVEDLYVRIALGG